MTELRQDSRMKRLPDLRVRLCADESVRISLGGIAWEFGPHALAVLDAFARPATLAEALGRLQHRAAGVQDWMEVTGTILQLRQAGILIDMADRRAFPPPRGSGYGSPTAHVGMLNDRRRVDALMAGIREVVRPGDVVLEIGTGTGILAVAAAKAGARRVYAVEASGLGALARAVFEANGLADRITLVEGWSTRVSLPEAADLLLADIIGNEPLGERVLEIYGDAAKRLLKPGARVIPSSITVYGWPMAIPRADLMGLSFMPETVAAWGSWYGMDLGSLHEGVKGLPHLCVVDPAKARGWKPVSPPARMMALDLTDIKDRLIDRRVTVTAERAGAVDGILEYFDLQLGPTTTYSTRPDGMDAESCRQTPVWVFVDPIIVSPGDRFTVTYQYRATENALLMNVAPGPPQRESAAQGSVDEAQPPGSPADDSIPS